MDLSTVVDVFDRAESLASGGVGDASLPWLLQSLADVSRERNIPAELDEAYQRLVVKMAAVRSHTVHPPLPHRCHALTGHGCIHTPPVSQQPESDWRQRIRQELAQQSASAAPLGPHVQTLAANAELPTTANDTSAAAAANPDAERTFSSAVGGGGGDSADDTAYLSAGGWAGLGSASALPGMSTLHPPRLPLHQPSDESTAAESFWAHRLSQWASSSPAAGAVGGSTGSVAGTRIETGTAGASAGITGAKLFLTEVRLAFVLFFDQSVGRPLLRRTALLTELGACACAGYQVLEKRHIEQQWALARASTAVARGCFVKWAHGVHAARYVHSAPACCVCVLARRTCSPSIAKVGCGDHQLKVIAVVPRRRHRLRRAHAYAQLQEEIAAWNGQLLLRCPAPPAGPAPPASSGFCYALRRA
jgi:hypothetical protein